MALPTVKHRVTDVRGDYERWEALDGKFLGWFRPTWTTGPHEPTLWKLKMNRGEPVVLEFTFTLQQLPGWPVTFEMELRDGVLRTVRGRFEATDDSPDPDVLYRQLGGDALARQIEAELQQERLWTHLPPAWQEAIIGKRRRGRRRASDLELALLAAEYCAAWEAEKRSPMKELQRRRNESVDALRTRLDQAVERGFFEKRGHGKSGGFLTPEGRRVIENSKEADHGQH